MNGITATIFTSIARVKDSGDQQRPGVIPRREGRNGGERQKCVCVSAGNDTGDHERIEADHGGCEASLGRAPSSTEPCRQDHGGNPAQPGERLECRDGCSGRSEDPDQRRGYLGEAGTIGRVEMSPGVVGVEEVVRCHGGGLDVGVCVVEDQEAGVDGIAEQIVREERRAYASERYERHRPPDNHPGRDAAMSAREKHTHEARASDSDQGIGKLRCLWRTEVGESQRPGGLPQSRGRSDARGDSTGKGTPRDACEEKENDSRPDNEGQAGPPEACASFDTAASRFHVRAPQIICHKGWLTTPSSGN